VLARGHNYNTQLAQLKPVSFELFEFQFIGKKIIGGT
jgi:hypothetical protein